MKMQHIQEWHLFESFELSAEQRSFLDGHIRSKWTLNSEGKVDVEGGVYMSNLHMLRNGRIPVSFGTVAGNFECNNAGLTSFEGAQEVVGLHVWAADNKMQSLIGGPREVGGDFRCSGNPLQSLKGAPLKIGGDFGCLRTKIQDLVGAPRSVGGSFYCRMNPALASLVGAPESIGGEFRCEFFTIPPGRWGFDGWMKVWREGSPEAAVLISSLLGADVLNQEIQKDPQGMIQRLKGVWDAPEFAEVQKGLRFPPEFGDFDKTIRSLQKLDSIKDFI
jgi:hypothetical protein